MEGASSNGAAAAANGGEGGNTQATQANTESAAKAEVKTEKADTSKETKENPDGGKKERSQKELFFERHKKDFPDDDEADEELFYKRHNERMAQYDKLKKSDDDFRKVISEHPQFGGMFLDAADGKDFFESLLGRIPKEDILAAYDDPERRQKLSETYNKHLSDKKAREEFMKRGEENMNKKTIPGFKKYCEEKGIGEEEAFEIWGQVNDFFGKGAEGDWDDKVFDIFYKAKNHDADVDNARQEGELKGHNAKVQATLAKGKDKKDIPPTFDAGQGGVAPEPKPKNKKRVYDPFRHEYREVDEK